MRRNNTNNDTKIPVDVKNDDNKKNGICEGRTKGRRRRCGETAANVATFAERGAAEGTERHSQRSTIN
jgi:hypothetical protein